MAVPRASTIYKTGDLIFAEIAGCLILKSKWCTHEIGPIINAWIFNLLRHSMPRWSERSLRSRQHPYPELQSKAWNATRPNFPSNPSHPLDHVAV